MAEQGHPGQSEMQEAKKPTGLNILASPVNEILKVVSILSGKPLNIVSIVSCSEGVNIWG